MGTIVSIYFVNLSVTLEQQGFTSVCLEHELGSLEDPTMDKLGKGPVSQVQGQFEGVPTRARRVEKNDITMAAHVGISRTEDVRTCQMGCSACAQNPQANTNAVAMPFTLPPHVRTDEKSSLAKSNSASMRLEFTRCFHTPLVKSGKSRAAERLRAERSESSLTAHQLARS